MEIKKYALIHASRIVSGDHVFTEIVHLYDTRQEAESAQSDIERNAGTRNAYLPEICYVYLPDEKHYYQIQEITIDIDSSTADKGDGIVYTNSKTYNGRQPVMGVIDD